MIAQPLRIALVGIDGSGKSSIVARLRERTAVDGGIVTLSAPLYHHTPNARMRLLSQRMHAVSVAADGLGLAGLKASILYLQMTLYGVIERRLVEDLRPRCLVSDRHALVDTLAYGPLYRGMVGRALDGENWAALVRQRLEVESPHALEATLSWHEEVALRCGLRTDFWDLAAEVGSVFERSTEAVVAEFSRRYATELPDVVVWLDIDPAEALRRMRGRGKPTSELHECAAKMKELRAFYASAMGALGRGWPHIALHRLESSGMTVDETLDAVLEVGGFARHDVATRPRVNRLDRRPRRETPRLA